MVRWTEIGIILSPEFITRVNILFISHSNLWIPFERSSFKNISKEKTKDRYFLQSMIEASLFGFISEWLTMETKRGSIHVSLRATHFPSPPPESFPKDFHPDIRFLVSSRILSSFVCIFHGTILRTIVVPLQPSFRPGNCFPFPRWNLALGEVWREQRTGATVVSAVPFRKIQPLKLLYRVDLNGSRVWTG